MGWSTRELAELAGTTVKTIRHYHQVGLLDEPPRASNGYKQYETAHLVQLLQVVRMKELGIPLAQVRAISRSDEDSEEAVRLLDATLAATIERLQRTRAELAMILKFRTPIDTPAPFHPIAEGLTDRDRSIIAVFSRVFDTEELDDLRQLMSEGGDADDPFEALDEDSDAPQIDAVAHLIAEQIVRHRERYMWLEDALAAARPGRQLAEVALSTAMLDLFNRAQLTALARALDLIGQRDEGERE